MDYNFTNAPINNQPVMEPKKESKIKPKHILIVIGALIVVLAGAIAVVTIVNGIKEQQANNQQVEDEKNAIQKEKEDAAIEKLGEKKAKIIVGEATRGEKELYEQDALAFINDPTTTGNSKAQVARSLAGFYIDEDRVDEAIELLNKIAHENNMTSNGTITCLMDLANIYAFQKDVESEKATIEEIINLPDHTMYSMTWDGGVEEMLRERLEQLNTNE